MLNSFLDSEILFCTFVAGCHCAVTDCVVVCCTAGLAVPGSVCGAVPASTSLPLAAPSPPQETRRLQVSVEDRGTCWAVLNWLNRQCVTVLLWWAQCFRYHTCDPNMSPYWLVQKRHKLFCSSSCRLCGLCKRKCWSRCVLIVVKACCCVEAEHEHLVLLEQTYWAESGTLLPSTLWTEFFELPKNVF